MLLNHLFICKQSTSLAGDENIVNIFQLIMFAIYFFIAILTACK